MRGIYWHTGGGEENGKNGKDTAKSHEGEEGEQRKSYQGLNMGDRNTARSPQFGVQTL